VIPGWRDSVERWGATDDEVRDAWPCDAVPLDADLVLWRAVAVDAVPEVLFRWLCQLRVAPYSYDWIDNWGRRSPRRLTPGLEHLAVGQRFMTIFRLAAFSPDDHITLTSRTAVFGDIACTYRVRPVAGADPALPPRSRLAVKLRVRLPDSPWRGILGSTLAAGDLVMMRKQLRTLAALAARSPARSGTPVA
jgi:hypothetical protein